MIGIEVAGIEVAIGALFGALVASLFWTRELHKERKFWIDFNDQEQERLIARFQMIIEKERDKVR